MTDFVLQLQPDLKAALWAHLLPEDSLREQAAFLFVTPSERCGEVRLNVVETDLLTAADFAAQYRDYLELSDAARVRVIKRAHQLGASLVEAHSHRGPWPAAFSFSDRSGLRETVPHMRWRLKRRPYIAVVVAPDSFDALVWTHEQGLVPEPLAGIAVGTARTAPTNLSLEGWDHDEPAPF